MTDPIERDYESNYSPFKPEPDHTAATWAYVLTGAALLLLVAGWVFA